MTRTWAPSLAPLALAAALAAPVPSRAAVPGLEGTDFVLTARSGRISTGDGNSVFFYGYANGSGTPQYPGPTLIVREGDRVTVTLQNTLAVPVSIVFPGQTGVVATGGAAGALAQEATAAGGAAPTVTYSFVATRPGTFMYHSGTRPDLQVEMGLLGALIVRPAGFDPAAPTAYGHPDTRYDREFLFLHSEMDPRIHRQVEFFGYASVDNTAWLADYFSNYWFFNGRTAPDTMSAAFSPILPTQPYNAFPQMHPGERILVRAVGGGRDAHPFHTHANHARVIATDARLLSSAPGAGPDLAYDLFTIHVVPGKTVDALFGWTGEGLGWDPYGHGPGDALAPHEYAPDHGKPFPVTLPSPLELTFGGYYSGAPFIGSGEPLPPGEGGLNPTAAYTFMWHSHTEKELTNFGLFPGGMFTMLFVHPPGAPIAE